MIYLAHWATRGGFDAECDGEAYTSIADMAEPVAVVLTSLDPAKIEKLKVEIIDDIEQTEYSEPEDVMPRMVWHNVRDEGDNLQFNLVTDNAEVQAVLVVRRAMIIR